MKRTKPVILIYAVELGYFERFEVQMSIEQFDREIADEFAQFVNYKICNDLNRFGAYEYDGKFGNFEYVIQTSVSDEDKEDVFDDILVELMGYFRKKDILLAYVKGRTTDPDDIENSFFYFVDLLNQAEINKL